MKEASRRNLDSGSTATVILIADGQILVANIGDSKAFLCSEKFQSPAEAKGLNSLSLILCFYTCSYFLSAKFDMPLLYLSFYRKRRRGYLSNGGVGLQRL